MTEDRQKAVEVLTKCRKTLADMIEKGDPEAWEAFTGLPASLLGDFIEWSHVQDVPLDALLLTVASVAYAHGREVGKAEYKVYSSFKSNC